MSQRQETIFQNEIIYPFQEIHNSLEKVKSYIKGVQQSNLLEKRKIPHTPLDYSEEPELKKSKYKHISKY